MGNEILMIPRNKIFLGHKKICMICGKHLYAASDIFCEAINHGYRPSDLECDSCIYTRQKIFNTLIANQEIAMIMNADVIIENNWGSHVKVICLKPIIDLLQNMSILNKSKNYMYWLDTSNVYRYTSVTNDIDRARKNCMLEENIL